MRHVLASLAFSLAPLAAATPAAAAELVFFSPLSPEVAGATGSGTVQVTFDTLAQTLAISSSWSGLSGTTTVAHIHCCTAVPGTGTVGVAVTPGTLPGFPVGVTGGTYATVLDLSLTSTYTGGFLTFGGGSAAGASAALLAGMQSGRAYFNVHTSTYPGGEIRGFLTAVPEPGTWALLLVGFALAGGALRVRRAARPAVAGA